MTIPCSYTQAKYRRIVRAEKQRYDPHTEACTYYSK